MKMGETIKELRQGRGISQETLAKAMAVTVQAVSKWERGASLPDVETIPRLAIYFGVTTDELFSLTEDEEFDRMEHLICENVMLTEEKAAQAEKWLLKKIEGGYKEAACYNLLALLHNNQAVRHRRIAEGYARKTMELAPFKKESHCALRDAMGGHICDWDYYNHHKIIDYYQDFVKRYPDFPEGYLWLYDNLIADYRFDEAEACLDRMAQCDQGLRVPAYRAMLHWYRGDRQEAHRQFAELETKYGDQWLLYFILGDLYAMETDWDKAEQYYLRAYETQPSPKYTDAFLSIAHMCKIRGDKAGALRAYEGMLDCLKTQWECTVGEEVDEIRREMEALQ